MKNPLTHLITKVNKHRFLTCSCTGWLLKYRSLITKVKSCKNMKNSKSMTLDNKFNFYKKYINKASAGGIRSVCTIHTCTCVRLKRTVRHTLHTRHSYRLGNPLIWSWTSDQARRHRCTNSHVDPDLRSVESQVIWFRFKWTFFR